MANHIDEKHFPKTPNVWFVLHFCSFVKALAKRDHDYTAIDRRRRRGEGHYHDLMPNGTDVEGRDTAELIRGRPRSGSFREEETFEEEFHEEIEIEERRSVGDRSI